VLFSSHLIRHAHSIFAPVASRDLGKDHLNPDEPLKEPEDRVVSLVSPKETGQVKGVRIWRGHAVPDERGEEPVEHVVKRGREVTVGGNQAMEDWEVTKPSLEGNRLEQGVLKGWVRPHDLEVVDLPLLDVLSRRGDGPAKIQLLLLVVLLLLLLRWKKRKAGGEEWNRAGQEHGEAPDLDPELETRTRRA